MEAQRQKDQKKAAGFQVLEGYGKTLSGVKVFPTTRYFTPGQRPSLEYLFVVDKPGFYVVELYTQPSNPVSPENTIYYGIQVNDREINVYNTIPEGQRVGDGDYQWDAGVLNNIRRHASEVTCHAGLNKLRIYAVSPAFVLEKLVIYPVGKEPAESYLGPPESYYVGKE